MPVDLDILDTNILVFAANDAHQWATDIHNEVLDGRRVAYLSPYVLSEFFEVMARNRGGEGSDDAWQHITNLHDADSAVCPHPYNFRVDLRTARHHAAVRTLATICNMDVKDAPILATAYRLTEFINSYDPLSHSLGGIPSEPTEFRLARLLNEAGVNSITARIITNERNFAGVNPDSIGLTNVEIKRVS